jgi:antirestriction protein ArdC
LGLGNCIITRNENDLTILHKDDTEYAYGELVAELAACFRCQACAVPDHLEISKNSL